MDTHSTTRPDSAVADAERGQVGATAAEIYDSFFVPALFAQFTVPVLDHAGVGPGEAVLDVGCGTGVLALAASERVGTDGSVVGLDPNDGMLAVASRTARHIQWQDGAAEQMPFGDAVFDHSISQFAAMFFVDRAAAVAEMDRVTASGGSLTLATWCALDRTPGYAAMVDLISRELGDEPADALRAPFVLGHADDVRTLLEAVADRSLVRVTEVSGTARFASLADWVHTDVRGWTLADLVDDDAERTLLERAERELGAFVTPTGSVEFPAPAIVAAATIG